MALPRVSVRQVWRWLLSCSSSSSVVTLRGTNARPHPKSSRMWWTYSPLRCVSMPPCLFASLLQSFCNQFSNLLSNLLSNLFSNLFSNLISNLLPIGLPCSHCMNTALNGMIYLQCRLCDDYGHVYPPAGDHYRCGGA